MVFSFLVVVATVIVCYVVIMRYAFDSPPIWGFELTIYVCAATYLLGGAYALLFDAHVKVDIFYLRWSPRVRALVNLALAPFFFGCLGLMFWWGVRWTAEAIVKDVTSGSAWDPVIWPARMLIPLGCFLLLLQGLAKYIRDFSVAKMGRHHEH